MITIYTNTPVVIALGTDHLLGGKDNAYHRTRMMLYHMTTVDPHRDFAEDTGLSSETYSRAIERVASTAIARFFFDTMSDAVIVDLLGSIQKLADTIVGIDKEMFAEYVDRNFNALLNDHNLQFRYVAVAPQAAPQQGAPQPQPQQDASQQGAPQQGAPQQGAPQPQQDASQQQGAPQPQQAAPQNGTVQEGRSYAAAAASTGSTTNANGAARAPGDTNVNSFPLCKGIPDSVTNASKILQECMASGKQVFMVNQSAFVDKEKLQTLRGSTAVVPLTSNYADGTAAFYRGTPTTRSLAAHAQKREFHKANPSTGASACFIFGDITDQTEKQPVVIKGIVDVKPAAAATTPLAIESATGPDAAAPPTFVRRYKVGVADAKTLAWVESNLCLVHGVPRKPAKDGDPFPFANYDVITRGAELPKVPSDVKLLVMQTKHILSSEGAARNISIKFKKDTLRTEKLAVALKLQKLHGEAYFNFNDNVLFVRCTKPLTADTVSAIGQQALVKNVFTDVPVRMYASENMMQQAPKVLKKQATSSTAVASDGAPQIKIQTLRVVATDEHGDILRCRNEEIIPLLATVYHKEAFVAKDDKGVLRARVNVEESTADFVQVEVEGEWELKKEEAYLLPNKVTVRVYNCSASSISGDAATQQ